MQAGSAADRLDACGRKTYPGLCVDYAEADPDDYLSLSNAVPADTESILILADISTKFR